MGAANGLLGGAAALVLASASTGCAPAIDALAIPCATAFCPPATATCGDAGCAVGEANASRSPDEVTFAVVGDAGLRHSLMRRVVAAHVRRRCEGRCDFVLLLGDNLYPAGIPACDQPDPRRCADSAPFVRDLEEMVGCYGPRPVYLTPGNHDYAPAFPELERAEAQLRWLAEPGDGAHGAFHFYRFEAGPAVLYSLDTNLLVRANVPWQEIPGLLSWSVRMARERKRPGWKIVFGHHPVLSNGHHHNAGGFLEGDTVRMFTGRAFLAYMRQFVIGRADLYLAGHDHDLQFYDHAIEQSTALVISGAGAKCSGRARNPPNATPRMEHYGYGFVIVRATNDTLSVLYHDVRGLPFYGLERTRKDPIWRPVEQKLAPPIGETWLGGTRVSEGTCAEAMASVPPGADACAVEIAPPAGVLPASIPEQPD